MTRGWMVLVGLVLFGSGVPVAQAFLDRSGTPRQTLILSNRELMRGYGRDENSGVTVNWSWAQPPNIDSLTRPQLDSLGVHCTGTGYDCDSRTGTRGWIVVALDTVEWQRSVDSVRGVLASIGSPAPGDTAAKRGHDEANSRLQQLQFYTSRLQMVGVGRDPDLLAANWNDGKHLILRARLWVYRQTYPQADRPGAPPLFSVNATPLPGELYVPVEWASAVLDTTGSRERLYAVTVAVGKEWLPRVTEVRTTALPAGSGETP